MITNTSGYFHVAYTSTTMNKSMSKAMGKKPTKKVKKTVKKKY